MSDDDIHVISDDLKFWLQFEQEVVSFETVFDGCVYSSIVDSKVKYMKSAYTVINLPVQANQT